MTDRAPRDALVVGRTIKTTRVTVLRAEPTGKDWWVCKCLCGREFVAHGWNVGHGRTRHYGSDEHTVQAREHQATLTPHTRLDVRPWRVGRVSIFFTARSTCPAWSGFLPLNQSLPAKSVSSDMLSRQQPFEYTHAPC